MAETPYIVHLRRPDKAVGKTRVYDGGSTFPRISESEYRKSVDACKQVAIAKKERAEYEKERASKTKPETQLTKEELVQQYDADQAQILSRRYACKHPNGYPMFLKLSDAQSRIASQAIRNSRVSEHASSGSARYAAGAGNNLPGPGLTQYFSDRHKEFEQEVAEVPLKYWKIIAFAYCTSRGYNSYHAIGLCRGKAFILWSELTRSGRMELNPDELKCGIGIRTAFRVFDNTVRTIDELFPELGIWKAYEDEKARFDRESRNKEIQAYQLAMAMKRKGVQESESWLDAPIFEAADGTPMPLADIFGLIDACRRGERPPERDFTGAISTILGMIGEEKRKERSRTLPYDACADVQYPKAGRAIGNDTGIGLAGESELAPVLDDMEVVPEGRQVVPFLLNNVVDNHDGTFSSADGKVNIGRREQLLQMIQRTAQEIGDIIARNGGHAITDVGPDLVTRITTRDANGRRTLTRVNPAELIEVDNG